MPYAERDKAEGGNLWDVPRRRNLRCGGAHMHPQHYM